MKNTKFVFAGLIACVLLLAAVFITSEFPATAQKTARNTWEYAAITGSYLPYSAENPSITIVGAANICFIEAQGCRNEESRVELSYGKFLQDSKLENNQAARENGQRRAVEMAYARAINRLGAEGWEMVSPPGLEFDNYVLNAPNTYSVQRGSDERRSDIYFKRAKQ